MERLEIEEDAIPDTNADTGDDVEQSDSDELDFDPTTMSTVELGFSLKKFAKPFKSVAKWAAKNPIKAAASAILPPVAAFNLIQAARYKKHPAAVQKVQTLQTLADQGVPAAQAAVDNLYRAKDFSDAAYQDEGGDYAAYNPPADYPDYFDENGDPGYYDDSSDYGDVDTVAVAGWGPSSTYRAGIRPGAAAFDVVGFSLKKLGRIIDPTKKGSIFRTAISSIPGVGPSIINAADTMAAARAGLKDAVSKVEQVKTLAANGNPTAQAALDNLKRADALNKAADAPWNRHKFFLPRLYELGTYGTVPVPARTLKATLEAAAKK